MQPEFGKSFLKTSKNTSELPSPDEVRTQQGKKTFIESIIATTILIVTILGTAGVYGAEIFLKKQIADTEEVVAMAVEELHLDDLQSKSILGKQIEDFRDIVTVRSNYEKIIEYAAAIVTPGTTFSSLQISSNKPEELNISKSYKVTITAVSDSFQSYLEQINLLQLPTVDSLTVGQVNPNIDPGVNVIAGGIVTSFRIQQVKSNKSILFNYSVTIPLQVLQSSTTIEYITSLDDNKKNV